jgi:hypothetical protein
MIRRAAGALAAAVVLFAMTGCDIGKLPPKALPSLPQVVGARVTAGQLQFWTGSSCPGVRVVSMLFGDAGAPELALTTQDQWGVAFDRLSLDGPYPPGMQVTTPLPAGFDWRTAQKVSVSISSDIAGGGTTAEIPEIVSGSKDHPDDTYYFEEFGWLSGSEVAAKNGRDFLTLCTPDPRDQPKVPRAFGARVTDGRLEIWTGSRCSATTEVILTFQPGQADLVLKAQSVGTDFERLTVGEPSPDLDTIHGLPAGFDWRTAKTLLLRVHADRAGWPSTTQLAEVFRGSPLYPADTYYFERVGWLTPADVAAKDGKEFLATCTRDPAQQ